MNEKRASNKYFINRCSFNLTFFLKKYFTNNKNMIYYKKMDGGRKNVKKFE